MRIVENCVTRLIVSIFDLCIVNGYLQEDQSRLVNITYTYHIFTVFVPLYFFSAITSFFFFFISLIVFSEVNLDYCFYERVQSKRIRNIRLTFEKKIPSR